jgi:hypothetical protein
VCGCSFDVCGGSVSKFEYLRDFLNNFVVVGVWETQSRRGGILILLLKTKRENRKNLSMYDD